MACRRISTGGVDLFQDEAGLEHAQAGAPELFGDEHRQPSAIGQGTNEFIRVLLLPVDLLPICLGELPAEGRHRLAKLFLLGA